LILRKIIKIVATRCQILRLKCTKFDFGWRSVPDPAGGAYSDPPDPLAGFKGPTSKGREGKEGRGGEGNGLLIRGGREGKKGKGGEGKGWKGRGREMEGPAYKGREVKGGERRGKREREGPPVITVSPGSRGAI